MKKKLFLALLSLACTISCAGFAACGGNGGDNADDGNAHVHNYSAQWEYDQTHHWHECTADGCTITDNSQKNGYAEHDFTNGNCVCGKEKVFDGIEFTLNSDNENYIVTGIGSESDTDLVIPSTYNGKPVISIGNDAFNGCNLLTSVTIPDSITSIGKSAFKDCNSLTSVTIADSVTSIANSAFENCPIEDATIPAIAISAIDKSALKTVVITSGESINYGAFKNCSSITSITIPYVGRSKENTQYNAYFVYIFVAINYSENSQYVPESLKTVIITGGDINEYAFYGCNGLTSITIAETATIIGGSAFYGCSGLTSLIIPENVTSIGGGAFYGCTGLTSLTIPENVTSIGGSAFYGCNNLQYNEYDNAYYIGINQNPYLVLITTKDRSITSCIINENTMLIYDSAFSGCSSLESITIPDSVTSIGRNTLGGCNSLKSLTLPFVGNNKDGASNTHFGYIFDAGEYSTQSSKVPASLKTVIITGGDSIGNSAFYGCNSITSITLPNSVTSIGDNAFWTCSSLTNITLPDNLTSIGISIFNGCGWLSSITLPNGITNISDYAFSSCNGLTNITISGDLTRIGEAAFLYCSSLTNITFNGTKEQWNNIAKATYRDYNGNVVSWDSSMSSYTIHCTDGDIAKN